MLVATATLSVGLSLPSTATVAAPQAPTSALGTCYPTLQSGCTVASQTIFNQRKWTTNFGTDVRPVCIADGFGNETAWPLATAAQYWNNATQYVAINVKANCVTAGYGPGRRATADTYSALDSNCVRVVPGDTTTNGTLGFHVYTENPIMYVQVNTNYNCNSTGFRRTHWLAVGIGMILGLRTLPSTSTWANRLMSEQTQDTLAGPSTGDAASITNLYAGNYVGECWGVLPWPSASCEA